MQKFSLCRSLAIAGLACFLACQHGPDAQFFAADAHASSLDAAATAIPPPVPGDRQLGALPSLAPLVRQLRPVVVNIASRFKPHPPKVAMRNPHNRFQQGPQGGGGDGDNGDNGEGPPGDNSQDPMERFFRFFGNPDGRGGQGQPGQPDTQERRGLGSGFLIGNGLVLTNNHVVEIQDTEGGKFRAMDEITVITDETAPGGSREYSAHVVGNDPKTDVAVVKIDDPKARSLPGATLGNSDALEVGDYVIAIGEPFGLQATVTAGIISAKERNQFGSPYSDYLQTDASINPGNSGGPLFNLAGQVVGINSAIISGANTIGFAIPIAVVKQILPQLEATGKVRRGFLGVAPQALTQDMVDQLGLKSTHGALIADVVKDSPASSAGLKAGDVIVAVNGHAIEDNYQLTRDVGAIPAGNTVKLDFIRDGKPRSVEVKVAPRPDEKDEIANAAGGSGGDARTADPLGLTVENLNPQLARRAGVEPGTKGAIVTDVATDSPGGNAGLEPGDLIVEANRQTIESAADYEKAVHHLKKGDTALLRVRRGPGAEYVTVKIPR